MTTTLLRVPGPVRRTPIIRHVPDDLTSLVDEASRGDEAAWNALVDRFGGLVWHVVRSYRLGDAGSEDVYQTTWLRLAEHLDRIRQPDSLAGWLSRTARNECLRTIRLAQRERLGADDLDPDDPGPPVERGVVDAERDATLWAAFGELPEACQRLLRLLVADPPLSYEVIGELLDMPIGSIGPTRARCLQKLRGTDGVQQLREDR